MHIVPDPQPQHPKLQLHDDIARAINDERISPHLPGPGVLTRWVVVGELLLPNSKTTLAIVHGDAAGTGLQSWDLQGMYLSALSRTMRPGR